MYKMSSSNMKRESCIKRQHGVSVRRDKQACVTETGKGNKLAVQISEGERQTLINTSKSHPVNRLIPQA